MGPGFLHGPFPPALPLKKNTGNGPVPGQVPAVISSLLALQGPLLDAFLDLVRHTRLDYIRGTARVGLGDPAATGMAYGLYCATASLLPADRINLCVIPEFDHQVCEVDITTRFRITYPVRILVNIVKVVKRPAARKVMNSMRAKPGDVAA